MKAEPSESVSSINLYADSSSILESFGGTNITILPTNISFYSGVEATCIFPDGEEARLIELVLDDHNYLVLALRNETVDYENTTIRAL